MFGGACLMWGAHMLCGTTGAGGYLIRVGHENLLAALALPGVTRMEMAGRTMKGYVTADANSLHSADLATLLALAKSYIQTLPAKKPNGRRGPRDCSRHHSNG
jgi:hypothetical protein